MIVELSAIRWRGLRWIMACHTVLSEPVIHVTTLLVKAEQIAKFISNTRVIN